MICLFDEKEGEKGRVGEGENAFFKVLVTPSIIASIFSPSIYLFSKLY
jgi:hypothetical protein